MTGGPALLVLNRSSRRGEQAAEAVAAALSSAGVAYREVTCTESHALAAQIEAEVADAPAILIGGGDGTLNAALPALLRLKRPLGVIPLGTANDLARTLGIPPDPLEAIRIIAAGQRRPIDIGLANDKPFFNVASIGFGVDLTRALTRDAKSRWGILGYAVAGARTLARMRRFTAIIEENGTVQRSRTIHLAVGNGRHYGGGMTVSETAAIDDGRLNVYSLEVRGVWRLFTILPALRRGDHGKWQEVRTLTGADILVRTRHPRSVNTDGEITTRTPVHFQVKPRAIEVFVP